MTVTVNGQPAVFPNSSLSVPQLLAQLGIDFPALVELNGVALFQREWDCCEVKDGDRVEVFRMVAGG